MDIKHKTKYIECVFGSILLLILLSSCGSKKEGYVAKLIVQVPGVPGNITVDETHIYWSTDGALGSNDEFVDDVINGSIMSSKLDGSDLRTLVSGLYPAAAITTDENYVFWLAANGIMKIPKCGGDVVDLVSWQAPPKETSGVYDMGVVVDGDIVVDESFVYWITCGSETISKVDKSGGQSIVLASGQVCPSDLEVNDDSVFWSSYTQGYVRKVKKDGTGYEQLLTNLDGTTSIAVDDQQLFLGRELGFSSEYDNTILAAPLGGGDITLIFDGHLYGIYNLTVYKTNLYWIASCIGCDAVLMKSNKLGKDVIRIANGDAPYFSNHMAINSSGVFFIDVVTRRIYYANE